MNSSGPPFEKLVQAGPVLLEAHAYPSAGKALCVFISRDREQTSSVAEWFVRIAPPWAVKELIDENFC